MRIISHRGNINGPDPKLENKWDSIFHAAEMGFDVEFDMWYEHYENNFFLGHDGPDINQHMDLEKVLELIRYSGHGTRFYIHCKSTETLIALLNFWPFENDDPNIQPFFHDVDDCIVVGKSVWVHPKTEFLALAPYNTLKKNTILVLPRLGELQTSTEYSNIQAYDKSKNIEAVCTDYPKMVRTIIDIGNKHDRNTNI